MRITDVRQYCQFKPSARVVELGHPKNVLVYTIGGKQFAYFKTSEPEKYRFSVRVSPDRFLELTDIPGVKPARYMGRFHWITIVSVTAFDAVYLRELIDWSYHKALSGLSRVKQQRITQGV